MEHTRFFTRSIALTLADALAAAGVRGFPVVGELAPPALSTPRLEVLVSGVDEIIPGNETYRLDCQVSLNLPAARSEEEHQAALRTVAPPVRAALLSGWKNRPLRDPRPGSDPDYEKAPFIVLALIPNIAPPEQDQDGFLALLTFRAYVQF